MTTIEALVAIATFMAIGIGFALVFVVVANIGYDKKVKDNKTFSYKKKVDRSYFTLHPCEVYDELTKLAKANATNQNIVSIDTEVLDEGGDTLAIIVRVITKGLTNG